MVKSRFLVKNGHFSHKNFEIFWVKNAKKLFFAKMAQIEKYSEFYIECGVKSLKNFFYNFQNAPKPNFWPKMTIFHKIFFGFLKIPRACYKLGSAIYTHSKRQNMICPWFTGNFEKQIFHLKFWTKTPIFGGSDHVKNPQNPDFAQNDPQNPDDLLCAERALEFFFKNCGHDVPLRGTS